eukprot:COSAG04_NODE_15461_length_531_cov_0.949074_1_plen_25_part_10
MIAIAGGASGVRLAAGAPLGASSCR